MAFWISTIGGILALGAWIWYYASLGKRIHHEEKEAGRDLSYEINPFTGSSKATTNEKK
ncbi:hypothetical protein [Gottfriedia acidiceleris]|uniref:hypothetical protein n=1 Tax=Gottfriedia acidiceleris TaxID=371036 RepID=UPI002FFFCC4F